MHGALSQIHARSAHGEQFQEAPYNKWLLPGRAPRACCLDMRNGWCSRDCDASKAYIPEPLQQAEGAPALLLHSTAHLLLDAEDGVDLNGDHDLAEADGRTSTHGRGHSKIIGGK
jgi:hypothetical protein